MELFKQKIRDLEKLQDSKDIECKLKEIERVFLTNYYIKINNVSVYPFEIEIYYFNEKDFKDVYTHKNKLQKEFNKIYPHNHYGYDLFDYCIALNEKCDYYLSLLFRSGFIDDKDTFYDRPSKFGEALKDKLGENIFYNINEANIKLEKKDNIHESDAIILYSSRVGLNANNDNDLKSHTMNLRAVILSEWHPSLKDLKGFPKKEELAQSYIKGQSKKYDEEKLLEWSTKTLGYKMTTFIKSLKQE